MDVQKMIEEALEVFTPNLAPAPFVVERGEGSWLIDTEGNRYLDFSCGIAVNNLGHCHPSVVKAVQNQVQKVIHTSNMYWNQPSIELAHLLVDNTFATKVFLCNSGAEANEAMLKMARKFYYDQNKPRSKFISFNRSFHGRTFGAISATAQEKYQAPFAPILPGFEYFDFNEEAMLKHIDEQTAGVLIEPIQGEGGIRPAHPEFLKALRKRCDETNTLLLFDEIQTGLGRTGPLYAYQFYDVEPDMLSTAKGLGGGLPIGALLCNQKTQDTMTRGSHATTFGGNPVTAASACAVLKTLLDPDFQQRTQETATFLWEELMTRIARLSRVTEIRGRGHMIGIEFKEDNAVLFDALRSKKILVNRIPPLILRILPPLTASRDEISFFMDTLEQCISSLN